MIAALLGMTLAHAEDVEVRAERPAGSAAPIVAAAAGWDFRADDLWSGAAVSLVPTNTRSVSPIGRVVGGWSFINAQPRLQTELGLVTVVKQESETTVVRFGVVADGVWTKASVDRGLPWRIGAAGDEVWGIIPGVMGHVEFEYGTRVTYAVGARFGVGSELSTFSCNEVLTNECLTWRAGFAGGFLARLRVPGGFGAEAMLGPTMGLSLGWAP